MNVWIMIAVGWATMAAVMAALWVVQRRLNDAGIVDVAWSLGVAGLAVFFAVGANQGDVTRRWVMSALVSVWAVRLAAYILVRLLKMPEDGRYQEMKERWGPTAQWNLFKFYQFQAVGSLLFALPMLIAARSTAPFGTLWDGLAVVIWLTAMAGEATADRQLHHFRRDPDRRGQVCRDGLWRYSRHPNYFFEWLHWWTYVCLASHAPLGWLTVIGPLAMLYFILYVTGIPPTEAQAVKSRGESYRAYQRTTSAFFPWPPKQETAA